MCRFYSLHSAGSVGPQPLHLQMCHTTRIIMDDGGDLGLLATSDACVTEWEVWKVHGTSKSEIR